MKKNKNKRTIILGLILVALLIVAYRMVFVSSDSEFLAEENIAASSRVERTLLQIENINFDRGALQDPKFLFLQSIEVSLPSLPIGRQNPFSK